MGKFLTIGYGDRAGYERTDAQVRDAAHAHDARLCDEGVVMGIAGPPVQVRNHVLAVMLALAAAVFVILIATFWWQDRKK